MWMIYLEVKLQQIKLIWCLDRLKVKKSTEMNELENVFFVRSETLGLFVNTLTAYVKYSHHTRNNFEQTTQRPKFFLKIPLGF